MFRALLLLAALGAAPASAPPAERWEPYPINPAWEMYGKEDTSGQFRWSQMRLKRHAAPVVNYGVSLPEQSPSGHSLQTSTGANADGAELVRDSIAFADGPVGRGLVGAIEASNPDAAALGDEAEHLCSGDEDCNDGQCPRRKPKTPPSELDELSGFVALVKSKQEVAFALAAVLLVGLALVVFCGLTLWGCRAAFLYFFREKPTTWEQS